MKSNISRAEASLACLLLLALLSAGPALGQPAVERSGTATFVLDSGETFENVAYEVNPRFKTIMLMLPDGERHVSFTMIESITDDGTDLTEQIIGRRTGRTTAPPPPAEAGDVAAPKPEFPPAGEEPPATEDLAPPPAERTWASENDEAYREAHASPWPAALRLAANAGIPMGDYYDGTEGGIGFEGDVLFGLTRKIALRFSLSRSGVDFKDEVGLVSLDPDIEILDQDLGLAIWRASVAAQYHGRLSADSDDGSMAFVYAGLGVAVHELDASVSFLEAGFPSVQSMSESESETKFLASLGGGLVKMMSEQLGLDLSAELDMIVVGSDESDYFGATQYAYLFDVKLGLIYFFE